MIKSHDMLKGMKRNLTGKLNIATPLQECLHSVKSEAKSDSFPFNDCRVVIAATKFQMSLVLQYIIVRWDTNENHYDG